MRWNPLVSPKHVKDDLDASLEAGVHSQFRGGVDPAPVAAIAGEPFVVFCQLESYKAKSPSPNGHDLLSLNKIVALMREAKSMPDLCWWIVSVPSYFVWRTAADTACANRPGGSSTSGHVIISAAHSNIM